MMFLEKLIRREADDKPLLLYITKIFSRTREMKEFDNFDELIKQPTSVWAYRLQNDELRTETLLLLKDIQVLIDNHIVETTMSTLKDFSGDYSGQVMDSALICGVSIELQYAYTSSELIIRTPEEGSPVKLVVPFVENVPSVVRAFIRGYIEYRDAWMSHIIDLADEQLAEQVVAEARLRNQRQDIPKPKPKFADEPALEVVSPEDAIS